MQLPVPTKNLGVIIKKKKKEGNKKEDAQKETGLQIK